MKVAFLFARKQVLLIRHTVRAFGGVRPLLYSEARSHTYYALC
jgi:hypothetical protein